MDAAYDAAAIHDHSKALGHAPIIDRNFRAQCRWAPWRETAGILPNVSILA